MKYTPYIIIVGLIVWVYLISNKPEPEPVEILEEIQVASDSLWFWKGAFHEQKRRNELDSIRWQNLLNERMKAVNYYRGEMNKRRDIPVPEADSLTNLMLQLNQ